MKQPIFTIRNYKNESFLIRHIAYSDCYPLALNLLDDELGKIARGLSPNASFSDIKGDINESIKLQQEKAYIEHFVLENPEGDSIGELVATRLSKAPDKKKTPAIDLAYWIAKPYQQQGIMAEAINSVIEYGHEHHGWQAIYGWTQSNNRASQRLLEKCGFHFFRRNRAGELCYVCNLKQKT